MAIFYIPFSLDLNLLGKYKPANQKAEKGCQENITIQNLTALVVFESFVTTKSVDFISKRMRGR